MMIPRSLPLHAIALAALVSGTLNAQTNAQFTLNPGQASKNDPQHKAVNPTWKLVWADEFSGTSVDQSKWTFEVNGDGGGNGEMQFYTDRPENAKVAGGYLTITGIKEKYKGKQYTSARLISKGKGDWLYGRFEARIKVPIGGKGIWPAFWMMPTDSKYGGWAKSGEIDILEMVGHQPNTLYGTLHYHDSWPRNKHTGDKLVVPGKLGDAFHTYAIEWEPGIMRWYFDGKLYQTQTQWDTVSGPFPAPFDQRFYFILNFAIGGAWPGPPAPGTKFPQQMIIDYVRAYQPPGGFPKSANAPAPAPTPAATPKPAAPAPKPAAEPSAPAAQAAPPAPPEDVIQQPVQQADDDEKTIDPTTSNPAGDTDSSEPPGQTMSPAGSSW